METWLITRFIVLAVHDVLKQLFRVATLSMAYRCNIAPDCVSSHCSQSVCSYMIWYDMIELYCMCFKQIRSLYFPLQLCRMQNIVREYCKIFAAEARVIENFGPALEWVTTSTFPESFYWFDCHMLPRRKESLANSHVLVMYDAAWVSGQCCFLCFYCLRANRSKCNTM